MMSDLIERQAAIDALSEMYCKSDEDGYVWIIRSDAWWRIETLPSAEPEIIRCKDCKFYSPTNKETKTGICNLIMHQNFGDDWFCAGAERIGDDKD